MEASESKISELIQKMTLEEKVSLCFGKDFWSTLGIESLGIPSIIMTDGPHGVRLAKGGGAEGVFNAIPATCFPTASALSSTWNEELIEEVGTAIAKECRSLGVDLILAPGINIKRSPLGGRNFEYYSEDPYLTARMGVAFVKGLQKNGVGACLKHFVCNESEFERFTMSSDVDERTLREIYLAPFEMIIKEAKPWAVMASYNKVSDVYMCENSYLLRKVLKEEWGFDGIVVSDWGAVRDPILATEGGLDLEMPGGSEEKKKRFLEAVKSGRINEELINERVYRILNIVFRSSSAKIEEREVDRNAHHELARRVLEEACVLLKNDVNLLPLSKGITPLAVIGKLASSPKIQGGGSSQVTPTKVVSPLEALKKFLDGQVFLNYEEGYEIDKEDINEELLDRAVSLAKKSEVVLLFVGVPFETEGEDRFNMDLPKNQTRLIEKILKENKNTVVIVNSGSSVTMPWIDNASTVLQAWLGGQAFGEAITNILFGIVNPSGKLAETFPKSLRDNPSYINYPGENGHILYGERVFVGYRYYDTKSIEPLFPFGHGLSYTQFEYSNLTLSSDTIGTKDTIQVELEVENTGGYEGKEVVQLYISAKGSSVARPVKELRRFEKIHLKSGEKKKVSFLLDYRDFAFYHTVKKDWIVEFGEYEVLVGSSSSDIRLKETFRIVYSEEEENVLARELSPQSKLKEWLANPKGKAVLEKYFGKFLEQPMVYMMMDMPLERIVGMVPQIPPQLLEMIIQEIRG